MSDADATQPSSEYGATIMVMGVGGGGGNTVLQMLDDTTARGIACLSTNTDRQALEAAPSDISLPIGADITRGLGAGAQPKVGYDAANESREAIKSRLAGADMLFITAGMGGGTGTGASPVVAEVARELGILTVAVVTRPFSFEGGKRRQHADAGIKALTETVDSLITIPNDKLMPVLGKSASLMTAFTAVNDVLRDAVLGIADMITCPGMINVDFADVCAVMRTQGVAKIGTGSGRGETRTRDAAIAAINSPLLSDIDIQGAQGVLVNITAGPDLGIGEFNEVGEAVNDFAAEEATIVIGTSVDASLGDDVRVTIVAAGLPGTSAAATPAQHHASTSHTSRPPSASQPAEARPSPAPAAASKASEDYFDIPAFLRREVK